MWEIQVWYRLSELHPPDKTQSCRTLSITDEELSALINDATEDQSQALDEEHIEKQTQTKRVVDFGQDKSRSAYTQLQQIIEASKQNANKDSHDDLIKKRKRSDVEPFHICIPAIKLHKTTK